MEVSHRDATPLGSVQEQTEDQRLHLIKLAANGYLESYSAGEAGDDSARKDGAAAIALTADNLGQIPDAEQLAPGIRLPECVLDGAAMHESGEEGDGANTPPGMPDGYTDSAREGAYECGEPGRVGAECADSAGVPPELDPRMPVFCPRRPTAGSVFSVAVQPGSPESGTMELEKGSEKTQSKPESPAQAASTRTDSPTSESAGVSRTPALGALSAVSRRRQGVGNPGYPVSAADSEFGSTASEVSSSAYSTDVHEQELSIERQRMRERELLGGELGIGGPVPLPFARVNDGLSQLYSSTSMRSMSTAATVATSPATSTRGSELSIPDSPGRRSPTPNAWTDPAPAGLSVVSPLHEDRL
ncbi:hypothetical protein MSPP1_004228 [Malassezia sp. CBS 17886]|nr:hypothetical protein MSPP1_004228 [Malassezia sp. CBS 17886]